MSNKSTWSATLNPLQEDRAMSEKPGFTDVPGGIAGQGVNDLIQGYNQGMNQNGTPDYSRVSSYHGNDHGVHTGQDTPTFGRHGGTFGNKD